MLALAMMLLNVNTLTEHLQWLLLLVHFANPTQWVKISSQGAFLLIDTSRDPSKRRLGSVRCYQFSWDWLIFWISDISFRLCTDGPLLTRKSLIWSPTYVVLAYVHASGGNLALVESLEQSHLREFHVKRFF